MIRVKSSAVTVPCDSWIGVIPMRLSNAFAAPSNNRITGPPTRMNSNVERASDLASCSGTAIARFFGASSPSTIRAKVDTRKPRMSDTPPRLLSGTPTSPSAGSNTAANTGSATKPVSSAAKVIPS